jgi:hypothetical protein
MERTVFIYVFFFHVFVVERVRLLVLQVPLDFHQYLVNWRVQKSPFIYEKLVILSKLLFCFGPFFFLPGFFLLAEIA